MSFSLDTQVLLSDKSSKSIQELIDNSNAGRPTLSGHSYDVRHRGVEFCSLSLPRVSGRSEYVIEITLETGEVIVCGPDQCFMSLHGKYLQARELHMGMLLMGLGSLCHERTYVIEKTKMRDLIMPLAKVCTVKYRNYALSCGIFVKSS